MTSYIFEKKIIVEFISKLDDKFNYIIKNKNEMITEEKINEIESLCKERYKQGNLNETLKQTIKESLINDNIDFITIYNEKEEINGILICKKDDVDLWTLDLICSIVSGIGIYLIGCFLYCLKCKNYKKSALLLAYGYVNMQGFCLYSKFGFLESPELKYKNYNIPGDYNNVKMEIDLEDISKDDIIQITIRKKDKRIDEKKNLCDRKDRTSQDYLEQLRILQTSYEEKAKVPNEFKWTAKQYENNYIPIMLRTGKYIEPSTSVTTKVIPTSAEAQTLGKRQRKPKKNNDTISGEEFDEYDTPKKPKKSKKYDGKSKKRKSKRKSKKRKSKKI